MRFLILRILTHSELGMFHEYRRHGKEGSRQRAINFDWDVVDRVFPAAKDTDLIKINLRYDSDSGVQLAHQQLKRQEKNWRLEGNCPVDKRYGFVEPGCLFAMEVEAGRKPATGAWAVFGVNDPVTMAILADGESSRLVQSAMISLHGDEGRATWRILNNARPDLFSCPQSGGATTQGARMSKSNSSGVKLPPNPRRLVDMLARTGHTMPSAIADLVDNAITADATRIDITFGKPDEGHGRWMSIVDNGRGMSGGALAEAMRIGSDSEYEANSLGKYGFGLKGASWSQADVFTVVTKQDGGVQHHLTWDKKDMGDWEAKANPLESWEQEAMDAGKHGTGVLWKEMRPPQKMAVTKGLDPHSYEAIILTRHLALVFHRFLEGRAEGRKKVAITINGTPVEPNDPVGHPLVEHYDEKTIKIPVASGEGKVTVQAFLLPHEDEIEKHHAGDSDAANKARALISLHGNWNDNQGLFVYRHDRLIKWGGWHEIWKTNDEKTKLARVVVDFDSKLDDSFHVNISKQSVQLPQQLLEAIKPLADLARKDSQAKYRKPRVALPTTPATPSAPVGTGPATGRSVGSGTGVSAPPPATIFPPASPQPPRVEVKEVKTDKFIWKVTKGITGSPEIQVSNRIPSLSALVDHIRSDSLALARLAEFLEELDGAEIQKQLMNRKGN